MSIVAGWNGQPHILIGIDNYIIGSHGVRHYRNGVQIAKMFDSNNAWSGFGGKLSDGPLDLRPGDQLNVEGRNTGGPGAFYFNYINAQGLQLGIDTSTMWTWYTPSGNQGHFKYSQIADGYGSMASFKNSWHAGQIPVQHGNTYKGPNFYNQATYKVFPFSARNVTHGFWLTVPPYNQWVGHVPSSTAISKGILRPNDTHMSAGGYSGGNSASMNQFLSVKMGTDDNEQLTISEMRDWLRAYSITNTPAGTVKFSDMSGSTIFGIEVKIKNESGGYPARYFNTNDAQVSVRPVGGSIPHGGKFKIILHGPGTPANDSVFLSATTDTYHTFMNLGGTAKNSSGYRYRIYVEDIGGNETYNVGKGQSFQTDIIVGTDNAGSSIKSVGGDPNSWNNTSGAVQSINFTGQSHQAYSNTVTVLCKPDI